MHIQDTISVVALFGLPYKLKPIRFKWSERTFEVREVTYSWKTREGQVDIYHFSVTDGKSLYELSFNTSSLVWKLERVEA